MNTTFEFRKIRDFGSVMNHSFDFIKLEYKRLGKALLFYALPFFIVTGIILVFVQISMMDTLQNGIQPGANVFQNMNWTKIGYSYLIQILNYTVLSSVVLSFIKLYRQTNGEFRIEELWPSILRISLKLLLAYIVVGIITVVACIALVIPAIYLGVVFSLVSPIIVFEEAGLGTSMSRCFVLIRNNWWKTFGIVIVGGLIIYIFSIVLSLPLIVVTAMKAFHAATSSTPMQLFSTGYLITSTVISIIQTLAYTLLLIFISIQYFSLLEEKERPTLQEKIDRLSEENA